MLHSYTGAPYFSAIASARLGNCIFPRPSVIHETDAMGDFPLSPIRRRPGMPPPFPSIFLHIHPSSQLTSLESYVVCTPPAAAVIKTYSPNLMVHPLLRETPSSERPDAIASTVISLIPNLHALVIGPGLGRDPLMQETVATIIISARKSNLPLVLDADALWLIQNKPDLVKGYKECVLTPNVVEFSRLAKAVNVSIDDEGEKGCTAVAQALGGVLIVRKGREDWLCNGTTSLVGDLQGGRKRSGGQGDTLTGCIATMLAWRGLYLQKGWVVEGGLDKEETLLIAAWGGSALTRECSRLAFKKLGRSMQASDLTEQVSVAFETLIGEKEESKI